MSKLRILHVEDNASDSFLVQRTLERYGFEVEMTTVSTPAEYLQGMSSGSLDLILADSGLPGFSGKAALELARTRCPHVPFIFVSGAADEAQALGSLGAGAADFVQKDRLWQLIAAIRRLQDRKPDDTQTDEATRHNLRMQRLVSAVQELSLARTLEGIMSVVRRTARELTGADGASFILRDGDQCFYADEDAIGPLWKGQRFPMSNCISGWVMNSRKPAVIEDIFSDSRVPADAYRPTFVKSLVVVPIRTNAPVGAIGNYWASRHLATAEEVELLQALANTTAVAMENVQMYEQLEQRVKDRTLQLEVTNKELEAFSYSVSHDLRAPLTGIGAFAQLLEENATDSLDERGMHYVSRIQSETRRMATLIDDLLRFAQFARIELRREKVNLSQIVKEVTSRLRSRNPERKTEFRIADEIVVTGDSGLLRVVIENLVSNAWKYSAKTELSRIEFGVEQPDGSPIYFVRDNGAGFDMAFAEKLFAPFQRLHSEAEFAGHGVGLATVQRIIHRHGGHVWADSMPGNGAKFSFTLGMAEDSPNKLSLLDLQALA